MRPLTGALAQVMKLRPMRYLYKHEDRERVGLVAEETAQVVPEAVWNDPEGRPDTMDYSVLIPVLVEAVQTLTHRLVALEAQRA